MGCNPAIRNARAPLKVDETYMGGKRLNMSKVRREWLDGRGPVDITAVVGAKDRPSNTVRAEVVHGTDWATLQGFVSGSLVLGITVCTDEAIANRGMPFDHKTVNHSVSEYVRSMARTNGIESFRAVLKTAHKDVYHMFSVKHLQRYVTDFAGRHNVRNMDTVGHLGRIARRMKGRQLTYAALTKDSGLASGARTRGTL